MVMKQAAVKGLVSDHFSEWRRATNHAAMLDLWARGEHERPLIPRAANRELRELRDVSPTPWGRLLISSVAQVLKVTNQYRAASDDAKAAQNSTKTFTDTWKPNHLLSRQGAIYRSALGQNESYVVTLPGKRPHTDLPMARIIGVPATKMVAFFDSDGEDPFPRFAMYGEEEIVNGEREMAMRVYDDEAVYYLTCKTDGSDVRYVEHRPHDVGVTPVHRFAPMLDLDGRATGEIEPFVPNLRRLDQDVFDRLVVQRYESWRVKYGTGMVAPETEAEKKAMLAGLRMTDFLLAEDPQAKFGSIAGTDIEPYIKAHDADVQDLAAVSQTPPHHLLGQIANLPLAVDTEVPTTEGMKTMGTLRVGDEVFAPDGTPTPVVALSPVYEDRDCYRITFDDGTQVVADADHKWVASSFVDTSRPYSRVGGKSHPVREFYKPTTAKMAQTLRTSMGTNNWFIPVAIPFDAPEKDLPIAPYTLGAWLGDGCKTTGVITAHRDDAPHMIAALEAAGEVVLSRSCAPDDPDETRRTITVSYDREKCPRGHVRPRGTKKDAARCAPCAHMHYVARRDGTEAPEASNASLVKRLKSVGTWKNKHIPEDYFWASRQQRLELLRGLMDTDGTVNKGQGSVKITLHHERLARDVHRLVQSLGHKARLIVKTANHKKFGPATAYVLTWSALEPVFHLPRKAALQRVNFGDGDGKSSLPLRRYVVSVERVPSVPVRCINVAHEAHMYCVTDAFVATHNSADALAAAEASLMRKVGEYQASLGQTWDQALRSCSFILAKDYGQDYLDEALDYSTEIRWHEAESRSLSQAADALGKVADQLGVPVEMLWEQLPFWKKEDTERALSILREKGDDALIAQFMDMAGSGLNPLQEEAA